MRLSSADITDGFWHHRPEDDFPPPSVERLEEYHGTERLNLACTQTDLPPRRQQKLVEAWCEALYVEWGAIDDLSHIVRRLGLRFLHLGSCPRITSIECLSELRGIEVLELENLHRVADLSVIVRLSDLEGLALYGGEKRWRVPDLAPLSRLDALRYLDPGWPQDEVLDLQVRRPELRIS